MPSRSISYSDLRNTPGRVFARLARGGPLPVVADGEARALLVPVEDGDVNGALDAWRRGCALLALARLRVDSRRAGTDALSAREIADEVRAARRTRKR